MMKKQMHPRNIYQNKLDFKSMAMNFPEFKSFTKIGLNGSLTIDFKDPEALRALAKVLLKKDFGLIIDIPINTLVPTIPLRLNYILFIEDLLDSAGMKNDVIGLDIGTGASCIYPLLCAKKNYWKMVATDSSPVSVRYATENVKKNNLESFVKVVNVSGQSILREVLELDDTTYNFCMCNPPFFGAVHELSSLLKSRKQERKPPNNAFTGSHDELITDGGEVEFATKMINESHEYRGCVKIFTTMLGLRKSIEPIGNLLKQSVDIKSFKLTEFFQGHTTRWGYAWTFDENINLECLLHEDVRDRLENQYLQKKKKKDHKPFCYETDYKGTLESVGVKLQEIFNNSQVDYQLVNTNKSRVYNIVAYFDTWTRNRMKRREQERMHKLMEGIVIPSCSTTNSTCSTSTEFGSNTGEDEMDVSLENEEKCEAGSKRKLDDSFDSDGNSDLQKIKGNQSFRDTEKLIDATMMVEFINSEKLTITLNSKIDKNRNHLHNFFMYVKNHFQVA